ncbi:hypothetical protein G6F40_013764 [Rhizopus arrhizus]|nr:hypothetical protein G6F40_013764 [Rhizopus arrhizus]
MCSRRARCADELAVIERKVNQQVRANNAAEVHTMALQEALDFGAMALFGEKYGEHVRVLKMGDYSTELCGGTHVNRTGDIGLFKIVSEGGVAAGVRRIEAITGDNALAWVQNQNALLTQIAGMLRSTPADVPARIAQVQDQVKALEKDLEQSRNKLAASAGNDLATTAAVDVKGIKVLAASIGDVDPKALRGMVDNLKDRLKPAVVLLATGSADGKISVVGVR